MTNSLSSGFKVRRSRCVSCIYNPDSPLDLAELEGQALRNDGFRICHHTDDACCRGFWNRHRNHFSLGRFMQMLGAVVEVDDDIFPLLTAEAKNG